MTQIKIHPLTGSTPLVMEGRLGISKGELYCWVSEFTPKGTRVTYIPMQNIGRIETFEPEEDKQ